MQQEMEARLQAERAERERMEREYSQRLEQTMQYVSSLGVALGHSPPQFATPPPIVPAATPVSDFLILSCRDLDL